MKIEVDITRTEPFKSFVIEMTTIADYIAQKANRTVMEQRALDTHREFMEKLNKG